MNYKPSHSICSHRILKYISNCIASMCPVFLAVIKFNRSGGFRKDKVLKAGVVLCAKAAAIGHLDAMRELGNCLQDGYGDKKNAEEGRKLLLEANAREEAAYREAMCCMHGFDYTLSDGWNSSELNSCKNGSSASVRHNRRRGYRRIPSQSDIVCNSSPANFHAINTFLVEWFALNTCKVHRHTCKVHAGRVHMPELHGIMDGPLKTHELTES